MQFTYLAVLAFTLSYPLYKSFEEKINYVSKWKYLWPAIFISAIIFIGWDIWFTSMGVWGFDKAHVLGFFLAGLPIEEWLFFFIVPFSCVFIYEVLNYFVRKDVLGKAAKYISFLLVFLLFLIGGQHIYRFHTSITFFSLGFFLLLHQFVLRTPYMGRYYLCWAVCMVPFLLVNGVLTAAPVICYNNLHILNIRIYTIPVEDVFYGMLQILMVITFYEYFKKKSNG
ncbi:MAG: lycopene cyclase domain-containing protein [Bacteroidia bacterium]